MRGDAGKGLEQFPALEPEDARLFMPPRKQRRGHGMDMRNGANGRRTRIARKMKRRFGRGAGMLWPHDLSSNDLALGEVRLVGAGRRQGRQIVIHPDRKIAAGRRHPMARARKMRHGHDALSGLGQRKAR